MLKISVPFVDLRGKTPIDLLRAYPDRALSILRSARNGHSIWQAAAGFASQPFADRAAHRWLIRNSNPYLYEAETFTDVVRSRGMFALNQRCAWSSSSAVFRMDNGVSMLRVMDSPVASMGKQLMVVLQQGRAGEYYHVTWPGFSGVFNAMAPGRFVAAVNSAPQRRHGKSQLADFLKNRKLAREQISLPPMHLLRQVLEHAPHYEAAKQMLSQVPLAEPAIFTLSGTRPGQGCVIERLEDRAEIIDLGAGQRVCSSNHFTSAFAGEGEGWKPREPDSYGRLKLLMGMYGHELENDHFEWLQAPVINPHTRVCMVADAASGRLLVQGYHGMSRATEIFNMPAVDSYAQQQAV